MKGNVPSIGVFGHYGNRNLGDEAIVEASIAQIRRRLPDARIVCMSLRPADSARRHDVEAFRIIRPVSDCGPIQPDDAPDEETMPWNEYRRMREAGEDPDDYSNDEAEGRLKRAIKRLPVVRTAARLAVSGLRLLHSSGEELRFLWRAYGYVKRLDLVVIAGSNQFLDSFGGTWAFPFTLMKWTTLARIAGTRVAFASVGANPIEHRLSKVFIRIALRNAHYISFRDDASKRLIEEFAGDLECHVYPDLAFGLDHAAEQEHASGRALNVSINPMPVYDYRYWFTRDDGQYRAYVSELAKFARQLIDAGVSVTFFGTMWRDDYVIEDIVGRMQSQQPAKAAAMPSVRTPNDVDELLAVIADSDIVVATRFHGTLLPLHLGVPVIAVSYYRKNVDIMRLFGQQEYCQVLEATDSDELWQLFQRLSANLPVARDTISGPGDKCRDAVREQWDRIVALIA